VVWDNSADNPHNPSDPPVRVRWGKESTDEMGSATLLVTPVEKSEGDKLMRAVAEHRRESGRKRIQQGIENIGKGQLSERLRAIALSRYDADKDGKLSEAERAKMMDALRNSPRLRDRLRR